MTVSDRIASERGENIGEGTVGYQIRLESKISKACSLLLVTTGVLLRRLTSEGADAYLSSLTHIIIDELHERDRFADFLMIVLKKSFGYCLLRGKKSFVKVTFGPINTLSSKVTPSQI